MLASSRYLLRTGLKYIPVRNNSKQQAQRSLNGMLNKNSILCLSTQTENPTNDSNTASIRTALIALVGASLGIGYLKSHLDKAYCEENSQEEEEEVKVDPGKFIDSLPTYTVDDLKQHNKEGGRIWVSYKSGVYDITDFIEGHPGGKIIYAGAGKSLEPFWKTYAVHHTNETYALLEEYRIGNLKLEESAAHDTDPFRLDPARSSLLNVLSSKPFNAESPKQASVENLITPNDLHFKRNHLPVPHVNVNEFELEIVDEINGKSYKFKLDELKKKYSIYTIPVTLQCSGNKRKHMNAVEPVQGLMWDVTAISTANWTGFKLVDLLNDLKIDLNDGKYKHVQFEGLDRGPTGATYGASIPKEKAFDVNNDVLVAFQMNGVDIPLDHGFPLRIIVPGVVGARSVKWLSKIVLSDKESGSHWQQNDYKILPNNLKDLKQADFSKYKAVQDCSVQSAICQPVDGAVLEKSLENFKIKGYAYSGGGKDIESVIVSIDGGKTWETAKLHQLDSPVDRSWAWTVWEYEVKIPKDKSSLEIVCVAVDSAHNTQPESSKTIWNARGLMNNAWHKIHVDLK